MTWWLGALWGYSGRKDSWKFSKTCLRILSPTQTGEKVGFRAGEIDLSHLSLGLGNLSASHRTSDREEEERTSLDLLMIPQGMLGCLPAH